MRRLTDGLVCVLARPTYRLEVWKTGAPTQNGTLPDGDYLYLTKIHNRGDIDKRSIGLPIADFLELLGALAKKGIAA